MSRIRNNEATHLDESYLRMYFSQCALVQLIYCPRAAYLLPSCSLFTALVQLIYCPRAAYLLPSCSLFTALVQPIYCLVYISLCFYFSKITYNINPFYSWFICILNKSMQPDTTYYTIILEHKIRYNYTKKSCIY